MNDTMIRLLRGALPLAATGMIQEVAQLTLSRMLEILPHPRQSSAPTFYMLAHSVVAVLVLMAARIGGGHADVRLVDGAAGARGPAHRSQRLGG
jgi:hypothetical protein